MPFKIVYWTHCEQYISVQLADGSRRLLRVADGKVTFEGRQYHVAP